MADDLRPNPSDTPPNSTPESNDPYAWLNHPAPWHSRLESPQGQSPDPHDGDTAIPRYEKARVPIQTLEDKPRVSSRIRAESRRFQATNPPSKKPIQSFWQTSRTLGLTVIAALLLATIFSYWTPEDDFLPDEFEEKMRVANTTQVPVVTFAATPLPTEIQMPKIGIIAGHSGPPQDPTVGDVDPGAVCDDNFDGVPELTELEINTDIAQMVVNQLRVEGYYVDLLEEFDPRLSEYDADLLISIHTNDCSDYGFAGTGYNVAGASARQGQPYDEYLVRCLIDEYGKITQLPRHYGVTVDMTSYHNFREVSVNTPVAIIETGFMRLDRPILTQRREVLAQGVLSGIYCFLAPQGFGPYAQDN